MRSLTIALSVLAIALTPVADAKKGNEHGAAECKIRHLASGTTSGVHAAVTAAVVDQDAWKNLWERHTANVSPKPDLPSVDFNKEMVIGIFDGDKQTGGYTVAVKEVVSTPKSVEVKVVTTRPSPDDMVSQMVTQPYDIVACPKSSAPVQRQDVTGE